MVAGLEEAEQFLAGAWTRENSTYRSSRIGVIVCFALPCALRRSDWLRVLDGTEGRLMTLHCSPPCAMPTWIRGSRRLPCAGVRIRARGSLPPDRAAAAGRRRPRGRTWRPGRPIFLLRRIACNGIAGAASFSTFELGLFYSGESPVAADSVRSDVLNGTRVDLAPPFAPSVPARGA